jgi:hypothetical protein
MSQPCPSPEKCLFAGCNGGCRPKLAAFSSSDRLATAQLLAREIAWRRPVGVALKLRDALATRRLLVALP